MPIVLVGVGPSGTLGTVAPNFWSFVDFTANTLANADALVANAAAIPAIVGITYTKPGPLGMSSGNIGSAAASIVSSLSTYKVAGGLNMVTLQVGTTVDTDQDIADFATLCDNCRAAGWYTVPLTAGPHADNTYNARRNIINPQILAMVGVHCDAVLDVGVDPQIGTDAAGFNATYYPDGQHPSQYTDVARANILWPILNAKIAASGVRKWTGRRF